MKNKTANVIIFFILSAFWWIDNEKYIINVSTLPRGHFLYFPFKFAITASVSDFYQFKEKYADHT